MGLDMSHGCWSGSYRGFNNLRRILMQLAGYPPLDLMEGFYEGGSATCRGGAGALPIRWAALRPDPLFALIYHSDCDGEIPWWQCGGIAGRLAALRERAARYEGEGWRADDLLARMDDMIGGMVAAWVAREDVTFR